MGKVDSEYSEELQDALQNAALGVVELLPDLKQWDSWIAYFLETLESEGQEYYGELALPGFEDELREIAETIDTRLRKGSW